jgi:opacity protein-like surface antigen
MRFTKVLAVAAMAVTTAAVAGAQGVSAVKPVSIGVSGGASIPTGDLSNGVNTGWTLNGHLGLAAPTLPVSFRGDVGYNNWGAKGGGSAHMWNLTGNAVFTIPNPTGVSPYIIGGIGAYKPGFSYQGVTTNSDWNFGFNAGAGVNLPLSGFNTFIEAKYVQVNTSGTSSKFVPITFGVMF